MILRKKYIDNILSYLKVVNSIFLIGARQVWKTTILKSLIEFNFLNKEKSFYVNFDEFVLSWNITFQSMQEFISYLEINYQIDFDKIDYFLFDEVKNLKNFNILLKSLIDAYPDKKFICTSSWNYIFINEIIEWLAWRALQLNIYGLDFKEFLEFKKLKHYGVNSEIIFKSLEKYFLEYISFWTYPKVVLSQSTQEKQLILKSILDSVILKDIKEFLKQEQIINFVKLIKYLSNNIGSKFSYEWLANDLWIKLNTVKKYLSLLEQVFFIKTLNPYFTDKKKEISNKSKLYMLDFWILNFYKNNFSLKEIYDWKDIEMFIYLQLVYNLQDFENLYFYQTLNETEIDFILEKNNKIIPIEVKSSNKDNIPKIFKFFCEKYKEKINYFIKTTRYLNKTREIEDCKVFLKSFLNF